MPAIALVLISGPDIQEQTLTEIPEELVSDIRASLSPGGSGGQRFLHRVTEVARVLGTHLEAHVAKDRGDALE